MQHHGVGPIMEAGGVLRTDTCYDHVLQILSIPVIICTTCTNNLLLSSEKHSSFLKALKPGGRINPPLLPHGSGGTRKRPQLFVQLNSS